MSNSNQSKQWTLDTKAVHSGQEYEQWKNREIVAPIVTSNTFYQNDPAKMAEYYYGRCKNPTREALERCLATLDNGKYGLVYPSGCAAVTAMLHLFKSGDHIISCDEQYGGTLTILLNYGKHHGIEIDFVDTANTKQIENAIKPNTKLIWIETPSNPGLKISDIKAIATIAHSNNNNIVVGVDNTFLTPYFQRPLELGADIAVVSLSKYMNGHNDVLGGAIVVNDKNIYETLNKIQTEYGSVLSPFDCYLVHRGLKTLPLRMHKHHENGIAIAEYLEKHPKILKVIHPGLPSHPHYELAKEQSSGHCGIVTFHLDGTQNDAKKFIKNLEIVLSSASLGCCDSYVTIPSCVTHNNMTKHEREKIGILDSTVRLSLGLEHKNDLIDDIDQALQKTFE